VLDAPAAQDSKIAAQPQEMPQPLDPQVGPPQDFRALPRVPRSDEVFQDIQGPVRDPVSERELACPPKRSRQRREGGKSRGYRLTIVR